jgi:hypothetical protein
VLACQAAPGSRLRTFGRLAKGRRAHHDVAPLQNVVWTSRQAGTYPAQLKDMGLAGVSKGLRGFLKGLAHGTPKLRDGRKGPSLVPARRRLGEPGTKVHPETGGLTFVPRHNW